MIEIRGLVREENVVVVYKPEALQYRLINPQAVDHRPRFHIDDEHLLYLASNLVVGNSPAPG